MDPFEVLPYEKSESGWFGSREPKRNAYVDLHNLIAAAGSRHEFGPAHVARIEREYDVDFQRDFLDGRRGLYAQYLSYCVADGALTSEERATLEHLRSRTSQS